MEQDLKNKAINQALNLASKMQVHVPPQKKVNLWDTLSKKDAQKVRDGKRVIGYKAPISKKTNRNKPCKCGSGKKTKLCCGRK